MPHPQKLLPDLATLDRLFIYDPIDGTLTNRINRSSTAHHGDPAGYRSPSSSCYMVGIKGEEYQVARVCYKMHHRIDPPRLLKFKNSNKDDWRARNMVG